MAREELKIRSPMNAARSSPKGLLCPRYRLPEALLLLLLLLSVPQQTSSSSCCPYPSRRLLELLLVPGSVTGAIFRWFSDCILEVSQLPSAVSITAVLLSAVTFTAVSCGRYRCCLPDLLSCCSLRALSSCLPGIKLNCHLLCGVFLLLLGMKLVTADAITTAAVVWWWGCVVALMLWLLLWLL